MWRSWQGRKGLTPRAAFLAAVLAGRALGLAVVGMAPCLNERSEPAWGEPERSTTSEGEGQSPPHQMQT